MRLLRKLRKRETAFEGPPLPQLTADDPAQALFPTTAGSWWDYQVGGATLRQTCRGHTVIDEQPYVRFDGSDGETVYYLVSAERVVYCPHGALLSRDKTAQVAYLEAGRRPGEVWVTHGQSRVMLLAGYENLQAAGRELPCWRVEAYNLEGDLMEQAWFALGVGLVRKTMYTAGAELVLTDFHVAPPGDTASLRVEADDPEVKVALGSHPTGVRVPFELTGMAPELLMVSALAASPELALQKMVRLEPRERAVVRFRRRWIVAGLDPEAPADLSQAAITCLHTARGGSVWIGTLGHGLMMWDGRLWTRFDRRNSLADDYISAVAEDAEGRLWVGTQGRGLACLERRQDSWTWKLFHKGNSALGDDFVRALLPTPEGLWVGTELGGLALFRDQVAEAVPLPDGCSDGFVGDLASSGAELLIATNQGVYRRAGNGWESVTGSEGQRVRAVAADHDQSVWWGTYQQGAYRLGADGLRQFCRESATLVNDNVWAITPMPAGTWVGTSRGASLVEGEDVTTYGAESVLSIAQVGEQVWVGTSRGVCVLAPRGLLEGKS